MNSSKTPGFRKDNLKIIHCNLIESHKNLCLHDLIYDTRRTEIDVANNRVSS